MQCTQAVLPDLIWVGGNDRRLALFENLFPLPQGVSYNSYLLLDEQTVLLDASDAGIAAQYLANVETALAGRGLDLLVVQHVEPDHSALVGDLLARWPGLQIVTNAKAKTMLEQFLHQDLTARTRLVKEGDALVTGRHTLRFVMAPMVHWPEVMMTFDETEGVLFSADAFGSFGALQGSIFAETIDLERDWLPEGRRYYANIVGKYGTPVQAVLKKAANLPIRIVCPLHGPVWRQDLGWLLEKYAAWSSYAPENHAATVLYGSMYGNTAQAAQYMAGALTRAGFADVTVYDISKTDVSYLIGEIFRCSHLVLASPTYNGGLYPNMADLLEDMAALNVQGRTVGLIENGSWAPAAARLTAAKLAAMKNMQAVEPTVTLRGSGTADTAAQLDALADAMAGQGAR